MKNGLAELEKKFSLLLFPLILSTSQSPTQHRFHILLKGFILSCSVAIVICLVYASIQYLKSGSTLHFFYHQLGSAIGIHAIYFAMYLLFAIFILIYFILQDWESFSTLKRLLIISWLSLLLLFIVLLASKTILISVFLFINTFAIFHFSTLRRPIIGLSILLIINLSLFLLITQFKPVSERFNDSIHSELSFINKDTYSPITPFTGISIRLAIWNFTINILIERHAWWLGVGTGGGQQLLDDTYRRKNMYQGVEGTNDRGYLGYNNHNQYFETLLELGGIGLIYLFVYFFLPAYMSLSNKNLLHIAFLMLFATSCLTESMLCTQKGTVFFALFQSLFLFQSRNSSFTNSVIAPK
jgi:hypothetical protein